MKSFILSLLFLVTPLVTFSQSAQSLLDEVANKVQSYDNISLDFKYSLVNTQQGISQETRGDLVLEGNKFILNLMGAKQLFDGNKLHVIIPEDEEINISSLEEGNMSPSELLTFFTKGFNVTMDIVQNVNGRQIQYVKLVPIEATAEYKSILLGIDKESKHIYRQIISQHDGTEINITVNQFKVNQPLSSTLFTFDASKYSDYFINYLD